MADQTSDLFSFLKIPFMQTHSAAVANPASTLAPQAADHDGLEQPARTLATVALMLAVGMATLDTAIANTALPAIALDIHASPAASVWIINAYQLAMIATLLPFAALGEVLGYRRVYLFGISLFTVASLGCALAWSLPALVCARVLQGV